ncbi:Ldh family oxidoreductase [Chloroflexi bacterium TSY]|nr:Ldh family oxidoreductase [Chloroflexi bacterium TSY]
MDCGIGDLNPRPNITHGSETPVTTLIDGDSGLGLVVRVKAMDHCIAKAQENGVDIVTMRRSRHFGMASYHAMCCLPHHMIGISLTNNAGVAILPTAGIEPMFSTNPISVAVPSGQDILFVLDMATSVVAFGKIGAALLKGEKIPFGWALDQDGQPTDDAQAAWDRMKALPLGSTLEGSSHKRNLMPKRRGRPTAFPIILLLSNNCAGWHRSSIFRLGIDQYRAVSVSRSLLTT